MVTLDSKIIHVDGVTLRYPPDIIALFQVGFDVEKGEFLFLTGPSGSGKTTLLRLLFCAQRPSSGEILIEGIPLSTVTGSQIPLLRRKIGVIFQDFKLLSNMTVFDNVALALEVVGLSGDQSAKRVRQVLDAVGLGGKADRYPQQLSGGEQQRVAIARAVVNRPPIVLADEPTGNLDARRADEVIDLMEELNAQGTTVIFATHNERFYQNTYRRVLRLDEGRIFA